MVDQKNAIGTSIVGNVGVTLRLRPVNYMDDGQDDVALGKLLAEFRSHSMGIGNQ